MTNEIIVEALLRAYTETIETLDKELEDYEEANNNQKRKALSLVNQAQELCTHSRVRKEDSFDYHRNEHWVEEYCAICNKHLRRY